MATRDDPQNSPRESPNEDDRPGDGGPGEAAHVVRATVIELAQLARRHRLDLLAHLLDMAQMEADEIIRRDVAAKQ